MLNSRMTKHRAVHKLVQGHLQDLEHSLSHVTEDIEMCDHSLNQDTEHTMTDHIVDSSSLSIADDSECACNTDGDNSDNEDIGYAVAQFRSTDDGCVTEVEHHCTYVQDAQDIGCHMAVADKEFENAMNDGDGIADKLRAWYVNNNISQVAMGELLQILGAYHELPKDPRTLLRTVRTTGICTMKGLDNCDGEYCYFGVESQLRKSLEADFPVEFDMEDTISLLFNVDGLPLFKSCTKQFWPILGKVYDRKYSSSGSNVFTVAIFCGTSKPASVDGYLHDFVTELCCLKEVGFCFHNKQYKIEIAGFSCDAPARAFVKCIKGHTGYFGCEKCTQRGRYVDGKMTFPEVAAIRRSDEAFDSQLQEEHHKGTSPLTKLGIGLVDSFPLDYMHLICLGVMKKLLLFWMRGEHSVRVSAKQVQAWTALLMQCVPSVCSEFSRKPRSFNEVDRWKAVEFRNFLIYFGPLVLRSSLPEKLYHHFMLLSVAVTILSSPYLCQRLRIYANTLLHTFVLELQQIYGVGALVYNMHNLIHLADDVGKFGTLDKFSCFPFESKLGCIKKHLRSGAKPLAQFCRRQSEIDYVQSVRNEDSKRMRAGSSSVSATKEHTNGPTVDNFDKQFSQMDYGLLSFDIRKTGDRHALMKDKSVVEIQNIVQNSLTGEFRLICKKFLVSENFFTYPCDSSDISIWKISKLSQSCHVFHCSDIQSKCIVMKRKDYFVALPLLHV